MAKSLKRSDTPVVSMSTNALRANSAPSENRYMTNGNKLNLNQPFNLILEASQMIGTFQVCEPVKPTLQQKKRLDRFQL